MNKRHCARLTLALAPILEGLALATLGTVACAQSVITNQSVWSNLNIPAGNTTYTTRTVSGNTNDNKSILTPGSAAGNGDLASLFLWGIAQDDNDKVSDSFTLTIRSFETITTNAEATWSLPGYLFGQVVFNAPGAPGNVVIERVLCGAWWDVVG